MAIVILKENPTSEMGALLAAVASVPKVHRDAQRQIKETQEKNRLELDQQ